MCDPAYHIRGIYVPRLLGQWRDAVHELRRDKTRTYHIHILVGAALFGLPARSNGASPEIRTQTEAGLSRVPLPLG